LACIAVLGQLGLCKSDTIIEVSSRFAGWQSVVGDLLAPSPCLARLQIFVETDAVPERVDDLNAIGVVESHVDSWPKIRDLADESPHAHLRSSGSLMAIPNLAISRSLASSVAAP
jgi:hypothetical protein